ncbi:hypothetical protein BDY24DRAFT_391690 [Mrakia frigida]|uniref:uncharacterized protein n=1 Tax=Mrakia frigida TaxID=29902 RepID=UPI003FCBFE7D
MRRLTRDISSIDLQPSSLLGTIPWDILHLVCQHSDEETLRNLCLVSYGMLEFAGPSLYHDVDVRSLKRLYSFFVPVRTALCA